MSWLPFNIVFSFWLMVNAGEAEAQIIGGIDYSFVHCTLRGGVTRPLNTHLKGSGGRLWVVKKINHVALEASIDYYIMSAYFDYFQGSDGMHLPKVNLVSFTPPLQKSYAGTLSALIYYLHDVMYFKLGMAMISATNPEYAVHVELYDYYGTQATPMNIDNFEVKSDRSLGLGLTIGSGVVFKVYERFYMRGEISYLLPSLRPNITVVDRGSTSYHLPSSGKPLLNLTFLNINLGFGFRLGK